MENKIEDLLIEMGIYPHLVGFNYICKAVMEIIKNSSIRLDKVYENVAQDCGNTASNVNQSIRRAFKYADEESEAYKKYIGIKRSCNSEMLYIFANKLKRS